MGSGAFEGVLRAGTLGIVLLAAACAGAASLREAPLDRGETLVFGESFGRVGEAAQSALVALEYEITDDFRPEPGTRVLLGRGLGQGELIEEVRLVIREVDDAGPKTAAWALCRRVVPAEVRIGGPSCEDRALGAVAAELVPRP